MGLKTIRNTIKKTKNKGKTKKIFNLLNDNEKFGLKFGLFPYKIRRYNLKNKELETLIRYARGIRK